jgi:hypothetical protein
MTNINLFKFNHSITDFPFIHLSIHLIFTWFRLFSALKMVEKFFFETLMTPTKLHVLNPRDSINLNLVHDMSHCLTSSFFWVSSFFLGPVQVHSYTSLKTRVSFIVNKCFVYVHL